MVDEPWYEPVKGKITELVERIIAQVRQDGVEATLPHFRGELFQVRLKVLKLCSLQDAIKDVQQFTNEGLNSKENGLDKGRYQGVDKALADAFVRSLGTYLKVCNGIVRGVGVQNLSRATEEVTSSSESSNYEGIKESLLNAVPWNPSTRAILGFLDASLDLDIGGILAELILEKEIRIPNKEKKALSELLLRSAEEFGVHASFLRLWRPAADDEEQIVRNIKIRNAYIDPRNEEKNVYTLEELKEELL